MRCIWSEEERIKWTIITLSLVSSLQDGILLLAFKECHKVLMQCNNQPFQSEAADFYMCKHILHVRPYKVSQQPVSIHLPISRLLAGRRTKVWGSLWFICVLLLPCTYMCTLIHRPLCTIVQNRGNWTSGCKYHENCINCTCQWVQANN